MEGIMYLNVGKSNGKEYLSIIQSYKDPITGRSRGKVIKSLGYLEKLEKEYCDPKAHFRDVAKEMTRAEKESNPPMRFSIDRKRVLRVDEVRRKNFGYAALSKIYYELGLDLFFRNNSRKLKAKYSVSAIMKLLIYSRILCPASKKKSYEMKGMYFEKTDFSLDDVYRSLTLYKRIKEPYSEAYS
jgi:hypothetical protein